MIMALRTTFRTEAARGVRASYELHFGDIVVNARVDDGRLDVGGGPLPKPDAVIEATGPINPLMSGAITPRDAVTSGLIRVTGDKRLLSRFAEMFRI
jgi:hypothetical protein